MKGTENMKAIRKFALLALTVAGLGFAAGCCCVEPCPPPPPADPCVSICHEVGCPDLKKVGDKVTIENGITVEIIEPPAE